MLRYHRSGDPSPNRSKKMNRYSHLLLLLGLPVHAVPKEFLEETLSFLIQKYPKELRTSYATTLKSAFTAQLSSQVKETLRQASFLGIDSKPLQILSRALGNPI